MTTESSNAQCTFRWTFYTTDDEQPIMNEQLMKQEPSPRVQALMIEVEELHAYFANTNPLINKKDLLAKVCALGVWVSSSENTSTMAWRHA